MTEPVYALEISGPSTNPAQELSKLLFEARESLDMWADVVRAQYKDDPYLRDLIARIDAYRAAQGWRSNGYGNELVPGTEAD